MEHRLLMPDGSVKTVRVLGHTLNDRIGKPTFLGAITDISAIKNAFEEIQTLKDQLYKENLALREEIDVTRMFEEIVGSSPALQVVLSQVAKVAPTDSTVLDYRRNRHRKGIDRPRHSQAVATILARLRKCQLCRHSAGPDCLGAIWP